MKSELADLLATLEQLREERQLTIPKELVEAVIRIQAEWMDDEAEAKKRIGTLVLQYLEQGGDMDNA